MKQLVIVLGLGLFVWAVFFQNDLQQNIPVSTTPEAIEVVEVKEPLRIEEKVGSLFMVGHWATTPASTTKTLIDTHHLGGVIVMSAPEETTEIKGWTALWQEGSKHTLLIAIDQEGGPVSRLKGSDFTQTAQRDITTPEEAYAVGKKRGQELADLGINTNFAPVVEASVNPNSFLYDRVFAKPQDIPNLAKAMMLGLADNSVIGTVKHYPGHADTSADSHTELPVVSLEGTTFASHTAPFTELFATTTVKALMTAHVLFPSIDPIYPATLSKKILTDELRTKTGYQGVIITDDMTMDAIDTQFSTNEASLLALLAGADMILFAAEPQQVSEAIDYILQAVKDGKISKQKINEHYERVAKLLSK